MERGDGGGEVRGNLRGRGWRDSRHSFSPKLVTKRTPACGGGVGVVHKVLGDGATDEDNVPRKRIVTGGTNIAIWLGKQGEAMGKVIR